MSNITASSLSIAGVLLVKPRKFADSRGYFMETYRAPAFAEIGVEWPVARDAVLTSDKDAKLPRLAAFDSPF